MEDIETTVSNSWTTVKFATTPRMATYLVAILVSDFTYNTTFNKQGLKVTFLICEFLTFLYIFLFV